MKIIFFLVIVHSIAFSFAQNNVILWNDSIQLTADNFRWKESKSGRYAAKSSVSIGGFEYKIIEWCLHFKLNPTSFDQRKSWILKKERSNKELLMHEKLHFDIAELYSRKFKERVYKEKLKPKMGKIRNSINRIHQDIIKEHSSFQQKYDDETRHHLNKEKQEIWNLLVKEELKKLDEYKSQELVIEFRKNKCKNY